MDAKNTKVIDGTFVVDLGNCLGGGSYSKVYGAWLKANPSQRCACKVISKQELDVQVNDYSERFNANKVTSNPKNDSSSTLRSASKNKWKSVKRLSTLM